MTTKERSLAQAHIDATDLEVERFLNRLESFLGGNIKEILKGLKTGSANALNAAQILGGIRQSLIDAGLSSQLQALDRIYGVQMRSVADLYSNAVGDADIFADADYKVVESLIKLDTKIIEGEILKTADQVASTVMRQVIGGQKLDADEIAANYSQAARRELQTELDTTVAGYYRSVTQAKAREFDIQYFVYIGPNDGITRPFCAARINKVYTRAQIAKWDNGTRLDAAIYGGGYNCRHDLVPISKERAEERIAQGVYKWG